MPISFPIGTSIVLPSSWRQTVSRTAKKRAGEDFIEIAISLGGRFSILQASNPNALPHWRSAGRIQIMFKPQGFSDEVQLSARRIYLSSQLIVLPLIEGTPSFSFRLSFDKWHTQINLKLWEGQ